MNNMLVLSNGYGEDEIAAAIIGEIKKINPDIQVFVLPLVGKGNAYNVGAIHPSAGTSTGSALRFACSGQAESPLVKKLGPVKLMPSGGLIPSNHGKMLWQDIKAGLIQLTIGQIKSILKIRRDIDLALSVGDTYPVILNSFFCRAPQIFIGTAKSNYFCPYSKKEKNIFKKNCIVVFPRDKITADDLNDYGVPAEYAGNVMMDGVEPSGYDLGVRHPELAIGLLPGSRAGAYKDFPVMLDAVEFLSKKVKWQVKCFAALSPSIDIGELASSSMNAGWELAVTGHTAGIVGVFAKGGLRVYLTRGVFADVINGSHIILGQAGTGNEQAAGLGKPVIAFEEDDRYENLGWYRMRQKGLLGDALSVVKNDPQKITQEIINILENPSRYEYMSKFGKNRMGSPGGAKKIAERVVKELSESRNNK